MKKICLIVTGIALGVIGYSFAKPGLDVESRVLGSYHAWTAYTAALPEGKVCYMAANPTKSVGKYSSRGDVFLMIAHRPQEKSFNVVSFLAGYTYKKKAKATIQVDKNKALELLTDIGVDTDTAWAKDGTMDTELIAQMKKGNVLVIKGVSKRGTHTTDTFSLKGFSKAYEAIQTACGQTP